ncbi:MAG: protein tyrosine phosphatase family protein [Hyphomicrobiales bacterium]|nr:protein tyrosine phosphatase family protein [Hyphomicrobiales bacterium]
MSDPTIIYNWRRFDSRITTSGQPTELQLVELKKLGIEHVINLGPHTHENALQDEAASLADLGLAYIHIPVEFERPTEADFATFCSAMGDINGKPVHVHCIANLRVSAFLYRWQREIPGGDGLQAQKLMDSVWRPGGVWAAFIGDEASILLPHRFPK